MQHDEMKNDDDESEKEQKEAEMYQHIKEAKGSDNQVR